MIRLLLKKLAVHDLGEKVRCRKEGAKQTRKEPGRFPIPTPSFPGEYLELRHCRPGGGGGAQQVTGSREVQKQGHLRQLDRKVHLGLRQEDLMPSSSVCCFSAHKDLNSVQCA